MTNEELAVRIQQGETELLPALWEQVCRFIREKAWRRAQALDGFGGVDVDDLFQSGFFALPEAVRAFDPASGYTFITYLVRPLKTVFAETAGYKTIRQKNDPLQRCADLDARCGEEEDGETLGDMIPDPAAKDAFDELETQQLREVLVSVIEGLPEAQRSAIIARYYQNRNLSHDEKIAERDALKALRQPRIRNKLKVFC